MRAYLQAKPCAILLILGPRSSGKTALLQHVLTSLPENDQAFPPAYLDARGQQLSDSKVLKRALQAAGTTALSHLSERLAAFASSRLGKAYAAWTAKEQVAGGNFSISGDKIVSAFLDGQDQTMNDVIEV